jgi:hypothetical protein
MTIMREEIGKLSELGPLPPEGAASVEDVRRYEELILRIKRPITDDEARVLVKLFGPDGCFGLALALVRLIESAPNWPLQDCLTNSKNLWVEELRERAK